MKELIAPSTPEERLRRHRESIREEVEQWRGRSSQERYEAFEGLLELADAIIAGSADPERMRRWQDPRSPEAIACWRALMRRRQSG